MKSIKIPADAPQRRSDTGFSTKMKSLDSDQPGGLRVYVNDTWYNEEVFGEDAETETEPIVSDEADIYLYDEISAWWGISAKSVMNVLASLDVGQINLHINSPGGEVFEAVAIYNALVAHKAKVVVSVDSLAASAASFIAQAGDEIIMKRGSMMMIHDASSFAWGDSSDLRKTADLLDKISNNIADIYANRAGGTTSDWRAVMIGEAWYTAGEAVSAGLADKVDGNGEDPTNKWDLSIFNFAGRNCAPAPSLIRQSIKNNKERLMGAPINTESVAEETDIVDDPIEEVESDGSVDEDVTPVNSAKPTATAKAATRGSVLVNGVAESDLSAIQAHINSLEAFRDAQRADARAGYVDSLVTDKKIMGPVADSLKALVMSMNDDQFSQFRETYDAMPTLPILGNHGTTASNTESSASTARRERIAVLEGIVEHHRNSGKTQSLIENLPSWKELQELKNVVED